jgi:hypothetical protein
LASSFSHFQKRSPRITQELAARKTWLGGVSDMDNPRESDKGEAMRTSNWIVIVVALVALQALAWAQQPARAPASTQQSGPIDERILPEMKFEGISLDEALKFIHDVAPGFNSVVVRAQGVDENYPIMPNISLKNVTIGQFLELIQKSYPIQIDRIDGPVGPIYSIRVQATPESLPPGNIPAGFGGVPVAMHAQQAMVRVYPLGDIITSLVSRQPGGKSEAERTKAALNDVLSLIQAALEQTEGNDKPILKVHEATQTLLYKGSPDKQAVVEAILGTLQPKQDPKLEEAEQASRQAKTELMRLAETLDNQRKDVVMRNSQLQEMERALLESKAEIATLKAQLMQAQKPSTPAKP